MESFAVKGRAPRSVLIIKIHEIYFQCARAIIRARLWDPDMQIEPSSLPTPGEILASMSEGEVGGQTYDDEWHGRAQKTMW